MLDEGVHALGGALDGAEYGFGVGDVGTRVGGLGYLVDVVADMAEVPAHSEELVVDFSFGGDFRRRTVEIVGGFESGVGEETGDAHVAHGGCTS
ncbi:hypothetical protein ADL35_14830 [Streptomyces sp. NRRL WC-3753]|nr:hypothetical protein ADL35_14830 [Streptomyces sp. NRRL WC-3753]